MKSHLSTTVKQEGSFDSQPNYTDKEFEIERYKYILQEIHNLNGNFHKFLSLFQALATAIVGAGVSLFVGWQSLKINPEIAIAGVRSLMGLLMLLTIFIVLSMLAGISSWFDYRREEIELLRQVGRQGFRSPPQLRNFWRWHETYVIFFIITFTVLVSVYVESQIIPLIR